jgi:hypothetical protein
MNRHAKYSFDTCARPTLRFEGDVSASVGISRESAVVQNVRRCHRVNVE